MRIQCRLRVSPNECLQHRPNPRCTVLNTDGDIKATKEESVELKIQFLLKPTAGVTTMMVAGGFDNTATTDALFDEGFSFFFLSAWWQLLLAIIYPARDCSGHTCILTQVGSTP